jgi:hypothetical protein
MRQLVLISSILCFVNVVFGQNDNDKRIYGGVPTANENMAWQENLTPNEKYIGVIRIDSTINSAKIIEAFVATFQQLQDENIMTKQMRSNNNFGSVLSVAGGNSRSLDFFSKAGEADSRRQYQGQTSWTAQFIDGVRLVRFYYNINVEAKDGKYKLIVTPSGLSGYGNNHIQNEWSEIFKDGKVKGKYSSSYDQMKTKLAYTIDQWINKVNNHLKETAKKDW